MKIDHVIFSLVFALGLVLLPFTSHSIETNYSENLLQRYTQLKAYCDEIGPVPHKTGIYPHSVYQRCYRNDGSYKVSLTYQGRRYPTSGEADHTEITWSDAKTDYFIMGYTDNEVFTAVSSSYQERGTTEKDSQYKLVRPLFNDMVHPGYSVKDWLRLFHVNTLLSDQQLTVLDYSYTYRKSKTLQRLSVSNKDNLIIKFEEFIDDESVVVHEMSNIRINPILSPQDLSFSPPLLTKYSIRMRPAIFISVLLVSASGLGFLFWTIVFLLNRDSNTNTIPWRYKQKTWRIYRNVSLSTLILFIVVGLLSLPMSGHPPLFIVVLMYALYIGLGMIAIGFFLFSAYLAHTFSQRLVRVKSD